MEGMMSYRRLTESEWQLLKRLRRLTRPNWQLIFDFVDFECHLIQTHVHHLPKPRRVYREPQSSQI